MMSDHSKLPQLLGKELLNFLHYVALNFNVIRVFRVHSIEYQMAKRHWNWRVVRRSRHLAFETPAQNWHIHHTERGLSPYEQTKNKHSHWILTAYKRRHIDA